MQLPGIQIIENNIAEWTRAGLQHSRTGELLHVSKTEVWMAGYIFFHDLAHNQALTFQGNLNTAGYRDYIQSQFGLARNETHRDGDIELRGIHLALGASTIGLQAQFDAQDWNAMVHLGAVERHCSDAARSLERRGSEYRSRPDTSPKQECSFCHAIASAGAGKMAYFGSQAKRFYCADCNAKPRALWFQCPPELMLAWDGMLGMEIPEGIPDNFLDLARRVPTSQPLKRSRWLRAARSASHRRHRTSRRGRGGLPVNAPVRFPPALRQ